MSKLTFVGGAAGGFIVLLAFLVIPIMLLMGAAKFSIWVLDWIPAALGVSTLICLVLVPLALIPATRGIAANLFALVSLIFGVCVWLYALAFTYIEWGMVGVLFGVVIFGVGVVLTCALAAIFSGTWVVLGNLVFLVALFVGARLLSAWLAHLAEQRLLRREMRDYPSKAIITQDSSD
ncbi:hypothetical protein SAMN06295955_101565 [Sphingopyxis indica]|uniref:Uncharacterized protein n=2 Tax=Sphingopyxis indica TaxID=436663 RepID=A0A239E2Y1_9SPHN|nr:hypothetical protein SAMN06295955_101565 [Sphingopyxis indica]